MLSRRQKLFCSWIVHDSTRSRSIQISPNLETCPLAFLFYLIKADASTLIKNNARQTWSVLLFLKLRKILNQGYLLYYDFYFSVF